MGRTLENPVIVEFPLRGSGWMAVTTPATRVPSHGVDILGEAYAYDFLRVDARPTPHFHPAGTLRTLALGVPTRECYAWGAEVHAPFDGETVVVEDTIPERGHVHPVREGAAMIVNGATFTPAKLRSIMGNHVIIRAADGICAGFAHLVPGSVTVRPGQRVSTGDVVGRVGHTGNSTSPHLHFQLMDSPDLLVAGSVACAFRAYEVERDGSWSRVVNGVPTRHDRIRSVDASE